MRALERLAEQASSTSVETFARALRDHVVEREDCDCLTSRALRGLVRAGSKEAVEALFHSGYATPRSVRALANALAAPTLALEEVCRRLEESFQDVLSRNSGTAGARDHYGVAICAVDVLTGRVAMDFTFRAGRSCCCGEPGCHFAGERSFRELRAAMKLRGIDHLPPLTIAVRGRCEPGALLGERPRRPARPSAGYTFDYEWIEVEAAPRTNRTADLFTLRPFSGYTPVE